MTELLKSIAISIGEIYLIIGAFMMIISYMVQPKGRIITFVEHLINISFIILWLPYFYIYFKYSK